MNTLQFLKRIQTSKKKTIKKISCPEDAFYTVQPLISYQQVEHFACIYLNIKNHIISTEIISIGDLNSAVVHPREVYNRAIYLRAAQIIISHNHPSGDLTPSRPDIEMTNRLKEAGSILGIDLLDHLIVSDNEFISLKEQGIM
jgi:DNA repair protein RadC